MVEGLAGNTVDVGLQYSAYTAVYRVEGHAQSTILGLSDNQLCSGSK